LHRVCPDCYGEFVPSPLGHALAGLVVAWAAGPLRLDAPVAPSAGSDTARPLPLAYLHADWRVPALGALVAVAPDLDVLLGWHRGAWHSLTAAVAVGVLAGLVARIRGRQHAVALGGMCSLVWMSHLALDWLGADYSAPRGLTVFWPFSQTYFESGLDVFSSISRRYWLPDEFFLANARSIGRELAILLPLVLGARALYTIRRRVAQ
jgi:membrane-bound metal-dependent hydrolase YbcI (DUF457 family)